MATLCLVDRLDAGLHLSHALADDCLVCGESDLLEPSDESHLALRTPFGCTFAHTTINIFPEELIAWHQIRRVLGEVHGADPKLFLFWGIPVFPYRSLLGIMSSPGIPRVLLRTGGKEDLPSP